jgi:single-stranded DNA-binding protein
MIRALIVGDLHTAPQARTARTGRTFATARVSVPQGDDGRLFCSVICFNDDAVARLLQLKAGASIALAGVLTVKTWTANDGTVKPSLDLVADEVAATTPRPRTPKPGRSTAGGDDFTDLPGAGDLDDFGGQA